MEELDLAQWIKKYKNNIVKYFASYDSNGVIFSVFGNENNTRKIEKNEIEINNTLAISIIQGTENICFYRVDTITKTIYKVVPSNYLLRHNLIRISEADYTWLESVDPDVRVVYDISLKKLEIKLSQRYNNFKLYEENNLVFYITKFNDPDFLYKHIEISLSELKENVYTVENIDIDLPFSTFTKPIFKTYFQTTI